jgi:hypothetical protein
MTALPDHPFYAGLTFTGCQDESFTVDAGEAAIHCHKHGQKWTASITAGKERELLNATAGGRVDEAILTLRHVVRSVEPALRILDDAETPQSLEGIALIVLNRLDEVPNNTLAMMKAKLKGFNQKTKQWKIAKE